MSQTFISRIARASTQSLRQRPLITAPRLVSLRPISSPALRSLTIPTARAFSSTPAAFKGLSPESENPQPTPKEPLSGAAKPAGITAEQYEELSNEYMDRIVEKLEQLQEEKETIDVEYTVCPPPCVLSPVTHAD
jgi:frataxin